MKNDDGKKRDSVIRVLNIMGGLDCGGLETTVMNYYRHIDRSKIQFDFLITIDGKNYYEDEAISLGARIFRRPMRTKNPIGNMLGLARVLRQNADIRIIHIHNSSSVVAIDAMLAMFYRIPMRIVHSHSVLPASPLIHKLFQPLLRITSTHWAGCSILAGKSLFGEKAWDRGSPCIIPNARDTDAIRYDAERRKIVRKELQLENQLVIIHVGRLVKEKNHGFLLEAFAYAIRKEPQIALLLVGDGELRPAIEDNAALLHLGENVRFLGQRDDVADLLQAADVFVLPSIREGLPGAAIEAQAVGLPCLLVDSISPECRITELAWFLPIDRGPEIWAESILSCKSIDRHDTQEEIRNAGYDIHDAAKWLEEFYLAQ